MVKLLGFVFVCAVITAGHGLISYTISRHGTEHFFWLLFVYVLPLLLIIVQALISEEF